MGLPPMKRTAIWGLLSALVWSQLRQWWPAIWRVLLVLIPAALFGLIWWKAPPALYRNSEGGEDARLKAITDTRTALLAGLIGVGALLTFWLNSRVYRITAEALRVTEQGQITERYTKAIEQLGSDKLDVRLGGIYALQRIAIDSERDHPTVIEVLSAFVREHVDPITRLRNSRIHTSMAAVSGEQPETEWEQAVRFVKGEPLATDVRAALTVLGRLPWPLGVDRADLTKAYLADADLSEATLSGFRLKGAHLQSAVLPRADLASAMLPEADLREADLQGANLQRADLNRADLRGGVDLRGADLTYTHLAEAHLEGANLQGANLQEATLWKANLQGANLQGANLQGANLQRANLEEANLQGAVLKGTNLAGVDLSNVRGLTREQLDEALPDAKTLLPLTLREPKSADPLDSA